MDGSKNVTKVLENHDDFHGDNKKEDQIVDKQDRRYSDPKARNG